MADGMSVSSNESGCRLQSDNESLAQSDAYRKDQGNLFCVCNHFFVLIYLQVGYVNESYNQML